MSKNKKKGPESILDQNGKRSEPNTKETVANEPAEPHPAGMSPFELLPPEILEIIIKMFMRNTFSSSTEIVRLKVDDPEDLNSTITSITNQHNLLVDVIANISSRFKTFASSKCLWKGEVYISGWEKKIRGVMKGFISGGGITTLHLITTVRKTDIYIEDWQLDHKE